MARRRSLLWRKFTSRRTHRAALWIVAALVLVAVFADFFASSLPIVLHLEGRTWLFPNVTEPPALRAWDNVRLDDEMDEGDWAIYPPVRFGPRYNDFAGGMQHPAPPSERHLLGTDAAGRDVLSRMIHGTRIALSVGIVAVGVYVLIGVALGASAGYLGGRWDSLVNRLVEVMLSFPTLFFILTIQGLLPKTNIWELMLVIGLTQWTGVTRLVRAEVLRVCALDYVTSATALGASRLRTVVRHILPNALGPVLVVASFGIAGAVLIEASLTFLGFGTDIDTPSWGQLLKEARESNYSWWLTLYPGLALFGTVTLFNVVGEGLRDAIDPRLQTDPR
jgi:peptide/nickel transport system permease protein